jgi:RNA polymerase sigma factor (sigma-70 family)
MSPPPALSGSSDQPPASDPDDPPATWGQGGNSFPATQWSLVLRAGTTADPEAHAALESLCRRYWYPLYAFVRRLGRNHHEAEDCTQDFLAGLLEEGGLQRARPERGRFRTFLRAGLRNFLIDDWRRTQAVKRGGGHLPPPLATADEQFAKEIEDPGLTPEQAFDRSWALGMIDRAAQELGAEYSESGRAKIFAAMAPLIWGTENNEDIVLRAAQIGLSVNSFTVALHRARRRLGERLRGMVSETVATPEEIDAELRHLVNAINGSS